MYLGSDGELEMHKASPAMAQALLRAQTHGAGKQPGEVSYCDTHYLKGHDGSNHCVMGHKLMREEDCRHAALILKIPEAPETDFFITTDHQNPSPFVKGCLVFNGTAYFNPTDSVFTPSATQGWKGKSICADITYKTGNHSVDSNAGCTGDFEPIFNFHECHWAKECEWGGMFCEDLNFFNASYQTDDAPRGCFRNEMGCYGFNGRAAAPKGNITGKTAVCKQKGTPTFNASEVKAEVHEASVEDEAVASDAVNGSSSEDMAADASGNISQSP
jgi:hypothetical protein